MDFNNLLLNLTHKIYRKTAYIIAFFIAVSKIIDKAYSSLTQIWQLFNFDNLDLAGCEYWEERLGITEIAESIEHRRIAIKTKWQIGTKSNLKLIQEVCDNWENGKIRVAFDDGYIDIQFISDYGIPSSLNSLLAAIDDVKPAHLGYKLSFKYLLIENIHEVKTLEEMEKITIDNFAFGTEE